MQTRTIDQIKVYGLRLNSMYGKAEDGNVVALATNEETLKSWYEGQLLAEPIREDRWLYSFKEGPLRNYNPLYKWGLASEDDFGGHGWFAEWVEDGSVRGDILKLDF